MTKKIFLALLAIIFVLSTVSFSFAMDKGNKRKGKYTYRKVYKACFERGEVESKTPPVSPADKTMAEWKAIFEGKDFSAFGCDEEWAAASDTDVLDVYSYFYSFAKDSPTPATCK